MSAARTRFSNREANLLAAAQRGNLSAWNDLVNHYFAEVQQVCYFVVRHHETAEDMRNETFRKAQANITRFTGGSFGAWLTTIARNTCADELRKQRRRNTQIQLVGGAQETLSLLDFLTKHDAVERFRRETEESDSRERVAAWLSLLPDDLREVVELRAIGDLPVREVARTLGLTAERVQSLLRRTRTFLLNIDVTSLHRLSKPERELDKWNRANWTLRCSCGATWVRWSEELAESDGSRHLWQARRDPPTTMASWSYGESVARSRMIGMRSGPETAS